MPSGGTDRMWGLEELPLPEPVSWFALTPGSVAIAAVLIGLIAWWSWRRVRAWQAAAYRRDALARLRAMESEPQALAGLPTLLRGAALSAFPRDEVASLRGEAWIGWLNQHGASFEPADAAWLDRLPYESDAAMALPEDVAARLLAASRGWVRGHRARV